nr:MULTISPECIES: phosphate/phosphite/phosphonate ABC transporter substrate-binding protein [Carboxydocella]
MKKYFLSIIVLILFLSGCGTDLPRVRWDVLEPVPQEKRETTALRVAVSSMTSPRETYFLYQEMIEELGRELGMPVVFIQKASYKEVNDLLRDKQVDIAFICSYAYVMGKKEFGLELLAVPRINGKNTYQGYIIVRKDGNINSFSDLKDKRFAFTDPMSFTGYFYPLALLRQQHTDPARFFAETYFMGSHDNAIKAVAQGLVDGAAVDGLIYEYMAAKDRSIRANTSIINVSPAAGMPPLVARPGLDAKLKERIAEIMLNLHQRQDGQAILRRLQIERFEPGNDQDYEVIRKLAQQVKNNGY